MLLKLLGGTRMKIRPIDIARKLNISTTTLRKYEEMGMIPIVPRTKSGYRIFTAEHVAYFVCIREMQSAFTLSYISEILQQVKTGKIDNALWKINKSQVDLQQEKIIAEKITNKLFNKNRPLIELAQKELTIKDVCQETGVPATTIRYWDNIGLLSVERTENNYRNFTPEDIRQILTIYAVKFSICACGHKYSISKLREKLKKFNLNDNDRIKTTEVEIKHYLNEVNRAQMKSIAALHRLCVQVENACFDKSNIIL